MITTFFDLDRIFLFTLLIARAAGLVTAAPFFGERFVPRKVKGLFAVVLALLMLTFAPAGPPRPESLAGLVVFVVLELSVGLAIGLVARLLIQAFEMAGHVIAVQIGFAMATVMDPMQGHRANLISRWMWLVGLTMFLGLNGHHHLLRAMAGTMEVLPPGTGLIGAGATEMIVDFGARSLVVAMKIGAPVVGVLLLTTVGLGILARTVPQMNVFIVGFPLKIAAGIVGLLIAIPYLLEVSRREVSVLVEQLSSLLLAS